MILFLKIFSQGSFEYLLKYLNLLLTLLDQKWKVSRFRETIKIRKGVELQSWP